MSTSSRLMAPPSDSWLGARIGAFYFFFFGAVGVYGLYFAPYLIGLGFTGADVAFITAAGPFAGILGTLLWGGLADRLNATTTTLRWCTIAALIPFLFLPFASAAVSIAIINVLQNLASPACIPLIDSLAYEWTKQRVGRSYARIRLFGSLGGLVAVQCVGWLLASRGNSNGDIAMPVALCALVAGFTLVSMSLPQAPPRDQAPDLRDLAQLFRQRILLVFLGICFVHWLSYAPYDLLYGVFLSEIGISPSFFATVLIGGALAEACAYYLLPFMEKRLSVRLLLILSMGITAIRWWALSQVDDYLSAALLQVLQGVATGLFWGVMVQALGNIVPTRLRVTGHALFGAIVVGGGNSLGYVLAGIGYDRYGDVATLFEIAAFVELLPLLALLFVGRRFESPSSTQSGRAVETS